MFGPDLHRDNSLVRIIRHDQEDLGTDLVDVQLFDERAPMMYIEVFVIGSAFASLACHHLKASLAFTIVSILVLLFRGVERPTAPSTGRDERVCGK